MRISNEITMKDRFNVHEKATDLFEAISDKISTIEELMMKRADLVEWPKSIIEIYGKYNKLTVDGLR